MEQWQLSEPIFAILPKKECDHESAPHTINTLSDQAFLHCYRLCHLTKPSIYLSPHFCWFSPLIRHLSVPTNFWTLLSLIKYPNIPARQCLNSIINLPFHVLFGRLPCSGFLFFHRWYSFHFPQKPHFFCHQRICFLSMFRMWLLTATLNLIIYTPQKPDAKCRYVW